jgi:adenine-specific DNA-methyltransferase
MSKKQKLELTWIGKDEEPKLEPRILVEDISKSYGDTLSRNMLIHGDNLLALKALEQEYAGKVNCIYADPPYNTGSAFSHYDDGIEHSIWLSLMKPRLELFKSLLHETGTLWVTLDDNEVYYFKVLADEIFGRNNFIISVVWNSRKSKQNDAKISLGHNYILVYSKDSSKAKIKTLSIDSDKYINPDNDPRGPWTADPFDAPNLRPNLTYPVKNPNTGVVYLPPQGRCWRTTQEKFNAALADNRIIWGKTGKSKPQMKRFLSEAQEKGQVAGTWWDDCGTATEASKELINLLGKDDRFATPKPERLIERVLTLGTDDGDLVLDSFLGSGTTAAAAHKMGRNWIGIELGEHAYSHCIPRLAKVIDGSDQGGISKTYDWKGGGGFKFLELAPSLLSQDEFGNWVIAKEYDANMLAHAMAKQEGFTYAPSQSMYWKQGSSTENDHIYTTTQYVSVELLDAIHNAMQENESLLIACKAFDSACKDRHDNITIKKIPQVLLGKCEFGKNDYNLNVIEPDESDKPIQDDSE